MATMQIDHLFIRARVGAPEAALLRSFGLSEGSGNRHPGQGTENRRFFFHNAFLELLWIANDDEVRSARTSPTLLAERLADASPACPFGICWRPSSDDVAAPFPCWGYTPAYLPPGMQIGIGADVPASEPMWFFLPKGAAPSAYPEARRQPLNHAAGVNTITSVTLTLPLPQQALSAATKASSTSAQLTLLEGDAYLMEICFDHGAQGRTHDCRPGLPLVLHY
ncbi:hypothetical protein RugamoR64_20110 [Duganella rhizosphaerae]|uniref:VOC family protein n=1 Tax=Duganella rhizosphaerae TaxID=2885763 RepID=UPI0030E8DC6F